MPAGYAHLMITDAAFEQFKKNDKIRKELRGQALRHSHFVHLGSVSPDYPYLDFFQPHQKRWADHMHYDYTGDLIKTIGRELLARKGQGDGTEEFFIPFAWALGYVSHVTADLVVHPIVFNIVGPYEENSGEHRRCEMIQDAFIYNKIRNGAEIEHSQLLDIIHRCSNPGHADQMNPVLEAFWEKVLLTHFAGDYEDQPPDVDRWHDQFAEWLGFAGRPLFVGRIVDPDHGFTYKRSAEIMPEERQRFLDAVPLPGGKQGTYEKDVFPKTVGHVLEKWTSLAIGLAENDLDPFLSGISNCNLDTGKDVVTNRLIYWE